MLKSINNENQYIDLVKLVFKEGTYRTGRNGKTLSYFGHQMRFDLRNNKIPLLTTKKVAWKTCLRELLWFINGETNNKTLKEKNVKIWNGNASREFLDSRGLVNNEEDDLGPIYGFQWNNFNGTYTSHDNFETNGVNQLDYIINALKNNTDKTNGENKYSRRLIVSAWNPCQLNQMALPPCHVLFQFYVNGDDELSCSLYQRSGDIGLGVPFNIASYAFLTHLVAHHCDLKPGYLIHTIGDCHIYDDHIEPLQKQINHSIMSYPTVEIINKRETLQDYIEEDFKIKNYISNNKIVMKMRV